MSAMRITDRAVRAHLGVAGRKYKFAAGLFLSVACTSERVSKGGSGSVVASDGGLPAHSHMTTDGGGMSHHRCGEPYPVDPRDDTMTGELVRITSDNGTDDPSDDQYDLLLPREILDWLDEQNWVQEHGDWHNIRRWDQGCLRTPTGQPCQSAEVMAARGLKRAPIQEGEPGDGYAFLVMHRHMLRGLQEAFPKHVELVRGFYHVPTSKDDPENPIPWVNVRWSDDQLQSIQLMEAINQHVVLFQSEDDYAKWVQFGDAFAGFGAPGGFMLPEGGFPGGGFPGGGFPGGGFPGGGFPGLPSGAADAGVPPGSSPTSADGGLLGGQVVSAADGGSSKRPTGGIHGPLHGQWSVPGSPQSLINNNVNVRNFAFWRLHGWIDDMWERYRRARNIGEDDPQYQSELIAQCEEMHELGMARPIGDGGAPTTKDAGPDETGVFATQIAPIFDAYCAGCHDALTPTRGLTLSGKKPSVIRQELVGGRSTEVSLNLVEPGNPDSSWLYRKLTGNFDGIDCQGCKTTMPLAGTRPTDKAIQLVHDWIAAGGTAD